MDFRNLINKTEVPDVTQRGGRIKVLAAPGTLGTTRLIMGTAVLFPGDEIREHLHDYGEEAVYVVKGSGVLYVDNERVLFEKGSAFVIRQGQLHMIVNEGHEDIEMVFSSAPLAPSPEKGHRELYK